MMKLLECLNITRMKFKINLKRKINAIRSDKYGEYKALFGEFYFQNDIMNQITPPYLP
jgi:hypothetical protein